ncbi:hypothetical protein BB561_005065 [Smittium simulii]|uniref:Cytochrome P450 n=1 Tax=Smittium simulii TaxID=133385 RepID=A0A2T9YCE8_9FUNG|nr:hypothetical protein BB561_005065 [Smittium simulii]
MEVLLELIREHFLLLYCQIVLILSIFASIYATKYIKKKLILKITRLNHKGITLSYIKNLETEKQSTSKQICKQMRKIGYMGKPENSLSDYIIGTPFLYEFASLPNDLFNAIKPKFEFFPYPLSVPFRYEINRHTVNLLKLLSNEGKAKMIALESYYFKIYTKKLFLKHSTYKDEGFYVVNNIFEFVSDTFMSTTCRVFLGQNLITDEKLLQSFVSIISHFSYLTDSVISIISKARSLISRYRYLKCHTYIIESIDKEILRRSNSNKKLLSCPNGVIGIIIKNREAYSLFDNKTIGAAFAFIVDLTISLNSSRLANLLMDISLNKSVYNMLANEQIEIIKKHGFKIRETQIQNMVYLDAALKESIRLTQRTVNERKVENDYTFSNGSIIPKGSVVKFDLFSHSRDKRIHGFDTHSFVPGRNLINKTQLSEVSLDSYTWSIGEHMCPAADYSIMQLKIAAASFIRNFEISQVCNPSAEHKGYRMLDVISHVNTELNLKPHNILEFNPNPT